MVIISHRGYWLNSTEKNSNIAFTRSFSLGFGTETDVRDCCGKLVISHDMPTGDELLFEEFLEIYKKYETEVMPLALNIKSDGLAKCVYEVLLKYKISTAFVFDMAVPDMRGYFEQGIPVFTRMSEVEQLPVWLEKSSGIWLDSFDPTWYDSKILTELLAQNKKICIVSPELHKRDQMDLWAMLRDQANNQNLILCTDVPETAKTYFNL